MRITTSAEAGALVKSLRESRGLSRKELSRNSGIPLRTVYAVEKGELNNLSLDRLVALLSALGAHLDVCVWDAEPNKEANVNRLVKLAATGTLDADRWGLLP
ncbi:MAG: helix-turn-helix transcriptional regulator [Atopobiaceae bacterium]|nr:helix-turn-helix transcriptional regulator [Atopobiaceae bacterium]